MNLRLFSFDAVTDVDSPDKMVSLDTALQLFDELGPVESSFIGFNLEDELSIQFVYQENGQMLVDVPDPDRGGSLQKTASPNDCKNIIRQLYAGKAVESIAGLKFVEW